MGGKRVFADGGGGEKTGLSTQYTVASRGGREDESRTYVRSLSFLQVREKCFLPFIFICFLVKYGLNTVL